MLILMVSEYVCAQGPKPVTVNLKITKPFKISAALGV